MESVGDAVTPSSDPALLLRLADPWLGAALVVPVVAAGIELHTESSDRERPMNLDTLPVPWRAASISVPFAGSFRSVAEMGGGRVSFRFMFCVDIFRHMQFWYWMRAKME